MRLTFPWPDSRLTPNAKRRKHWSVYHGAAKKARADAWAITLAELSPRQKLELAVSSHIEMVVRFYPPDARRRDADGMIGQAKHLFDGVSDALGIDDRHFRMTFEICEPAKPGRIEITLGA